MKHSSSAQRGFSMMELTVAMALTMVLMGAVYTQVKIAQQRSSSEQNIVDMFQESREFMDQMVRDIQQAGYPNSNNLVPAAAGTDIREDSGNAVGLVKVDTNFLMLEGDVNGDGAVESVQIYYSADGVNCPCLRRSQILKVNGDPLHGQGLLSPASSSFTEVQDVLNGTGTSDAIFSAYDVNGDVIPLPVAYDTDPVNLARIKSVKISLNVQARQNDAQTGAPAQTMLVSTVQLLNCSQAISGQPNSCQK